MSSRLKILRVIPFFEPAKSFGGSVAQSAATAEELASRGHQVSILTSDLGIDADMARDRWVDRKGYRVFYASAKGACTRPPYPSACTEETILPAMQEADLLCMNVGLTLLNSKLRKLSRAQDLPYVYNAEGALCPLRLRQKRLAKSVFLRLVERRIIREASALHAVTAKERQDLIRQGAMPEKIHVIPNAVPMTAASEHGTDLSLRNSLSIPDKACVLLFLGRLNAMKGVHLLLEASLEILGAQQDVHMIFAGPDEGCQAELMATARRARVNEQVHFPGVIAAPDRRAALQSADVFLLPSLSEGLPLAALEAGAAGLPLLLSEGCHLPEVRDNDAGQVLSLQPEVWRRSIREMLANPQRRREQGANAAKMVREQFALGPTVDRLEALYQELADR